MYFVNLGVKGLSDNSKPKRPHERNAHWRGAQLDHQRLASEFFAFVMTHFAL